jgi:hypothetical protein
MSEAKSELEAFKEMMRGFVEYYDRFNAFYHDIIMEIPYDDTLPFISIKIGSKQVMSGIQEALKVLEHLQK